MNTLKFTGISFAAISSLVGCKTNESKDKLPPNIIFIVSEDNSPFLGCYGDSKANTPNLDKLASEGILYENAFACAPVCAPSRSTIITGMYANSLGTHHMRSNNTIPEEFHFFPYYLKQAGYYTVNRMKKDYNIPDQTGVWDQDDWWNYKEMLKDRQPGQPFFVMFNTFMSHESKIHGERSKMLDYYKNASIESMTGVPASQARIDSFNFMHEVGSIPLPPYHPSTPEMAEDWARYYDCMSMMDDEIGEFLSNLERDTLLENTIIFYFSDHGGVIARSKRFTYESGLKVPFIVKFPENYSHLAPAEPGSRLDRVISFVDLAPTVLNLAGLDIPENFQGFPFLGTNSDEEREYACGFRGRMDERYDFCRTIRNKQYRYIKNYMPHRIWGQHVNYLWRAKSIGSWEEICKEGECNETQTRFWNTKPVEELYDAEKDPHNVNNLAEDPAYKDILVKMREANADWMAEINDKNFIPEGEYLKNLTDTNGFDYYAGKNYNYKAIKKMADIAVEGKTENLPALESAFDSTDPVIRFWGAIGCCILQDEASPLRDKLKTLLSDESLDVKIAAAEALYFMGEKAMAKNALQEILSMEGEGPNGSWEMVRTHAFNVVDLFDDPDKRFFETEIRRISAREKVGYDKRMADYLMEQLLF